MSKIKSFKGSNDINLINNHHQRKGKAEMKIRAEEDDWKCFT